VLHDNILPMIWGLITGILLGILLVFGLMTANNFKICGGDNEKEIQKCCREEADGDKF
jgi:hypothetical protein